MASKISHERYVWWRKQFTDDAEQCQLEIELWISGGLSALLALDVSGGDVGKKHRALAPFSGTIVERDDIVGVLKNVYAACLENDDKVALSAYRIALQNVAQPLPLGRLDPDVQLIALEACTDLGFWELCNGLLRCSEQLFSLSGPLLRAVRAYAKGLHADGGRDLLRRLIAETKKHPSRNAWRYWTLVTALDHCADRDISVQRSAALELVAYALDVRNVETIPELERQQITVALLYRMCPEYLAALTTDQAAQFISALELLDYPTYNDGDVIDKFCTYADEVALESTNDLALSWTCELWCAAAAEPQFASDAVNERLDRQRQQLVQQGASSDANKNQK